MEAAGECGDFDLVRKVIDLKMWKVKTLNLGLSPSPEPVRRELLRTECYQGGAPAGRRPLTSESHRSGAAGGFVGPEALQLQENTSGGRRGALS